MIQRCMYVPQSMQLFGNIPFRARLKQLSIGIGRRMARRIHHCLIGLESGSWIVLSIQSVGYRCQCAQTKAIILRMTRCHAIQ